MIKLFTSAKIKSVTKEEENDVYEVLVSSGKVDRLGDTIDPNGWYLKNYNKNPVILWSHSSGGMFGVAIPPVGQAIKTWVENEKELRQKQIFASTPFAQELKTLVDGRFLRAQSVGFMPLVEDSEKGTEEIEGKMYRKVYDEELKTYMEKGFVEIARKKYSKDGEHFTKQELLEVSWVDVPALPQALVSARKMNLDLVTKALEEEIKEKETETEEKTEAVEKPYPNEHSCRLKDPDDYSTCRRTSRTSDGKKYSVLTCRRKDDSTKWEEQGYRYPKDVWTESEARKHCKDHKGIKFEPASEKELSKEAELENRISKMEEVIGDLKDKLDPGDTTPKEDVKGRKPFTEQKSKKSDAERLLIMFDKMCEILLRKLRQPNAKEKSKEK